MGVGGGAIFDPIAAPDEVIEPSEDVRMTPKRITLFFIDHQAGSKYRNFPRMRRTLIYDKGLFKAFVFQNLVLALFKKF